MSGIKQSWTRNPSVLPCVVDQTARPHSLCRMTLKVVIEKGQDGFFSAHCPSLKSCWSQGRTREEALRNIREAIDLYLEPSAKEIVENETREVVALSL